VDLLPQLLIPLVIIGGIGYLFVRRNSERERNAPLRAEIAALVRFETALDLVSMLGTGGFGGTSGAWIPLRGPKRLVVGSDAFMISAPQALREYVFNGREASVAISQEPSRRAVRDWIIISGQAGGREVQLAIARDNLPEIWQALAETGATLLSDRPPPRQPSSSAAGISARLGRLSLRGLAAALVIVLLVDTVAWLGVSALPALGGPASFGLFVVCVLFVTWFYRARVNAEGRGWPQRLPPVWAVAGWIAPLVNFWFPFQIMADIWRAGLPAEERANRATLPGIWWASLVALALLWSALGPAIHLWYVGIPVRIIGVLAAILTALLVRRVSDGPLGQPR
jgi:hypothetical protein